MKKWIIFLWFKSTCPHIFVFSTELIPKYLESFEKKFATQKEKEDDEKQKENNKQGLRELRDEMVFSVFMLNAIFVVVVSLVQQEKETLSFNWFFPKGWIHKQCCIFLFSSPVAFYNVKPHYLIFIFLDVNGTFVEYSYGESFPTVRIQQVYVKMDPIGFVFLFFFAIVMIIQVVTYIINLMVVTITIYHKMTTLFCKIFIILFQVIGMLFHRWETISHIISDTRLPWLMGKDTVDDNQFDFADEENQGKKC